MKQETLEEATEKYFLKKYSWTGTNHLPYKEEDVKLTKDDFIAGAKWQQEQMEKLKDFDTWKEWKNEKS
jgi:hypothetical protein